MSRNSRTGSGQPPAVGISPSRLVSRSLAFYWRTNLAMLAGVAVAITVLSGALLVGDSVRGSLRDLVVQRLGRTDLVVMSAEFFREALADDVRSSPSPTAALRDISPIISIQGVAIDQASGRRSSRVQVYGVDDRFWRFHNVPNTKAPGSREILLSRALAKELGTVQGATILLRVQRPTDIPLESLHGRKEDLGRTLRLTVRDVIAREALGEFSLQPQQGEVRAAFVSLHRLQQDLGIEGRVNTLLVSAADSGSADGPRAQLESMIRSSARLEDLGLTVRILAGRPMLSIESAAGLIDAVRSDAANKAAEDEGLPARPVLTYLANTLRVGTREIPYSVVTALDLTTIAPTFGEARRRRADAGATGVRGEAPLVLNDWAARDLQAKVGDPITLEYFLWEDPGRLVTRSASFEVAAIVPLAGAADDQDLAPTYPGITDSANLRDWDPPFPIDLRRVRPIDEEYWRAHRTTPKAFIPLEVGQSLWRSRYGAVTSIRLMLSAGLSPDAARDQYATRLRAALDPVSAGVSVRDVRAEGLTASRGATDFGEYFTYFSFFLVISALMLAALFFRLGVEQRAHEIGLLRAVGLTPAFIRRLFSAEALVLSLAGALLGAIGAMGYAAAMIAGLRTWWVNAVGTTALALHPTTSSILIGIAGGIAAALLCVWWTLRALGHVSERSLLAGQITRDEGPSRLAGRGAPLAGAVLLLAVAGALIAGTRAGAIDRTGAFFGAGASLLAASVCGFLAMVRPRTGSWAPGRGWRAVSRLGLRNVVHRPVRSALSMAVMASATFVLISVDAFRRTDSVDLSDPHSGVGGYSLMVNTVLPLVNDPDSVEGRELLNLSPASEVGVTPFRVLSGDDVSCLNLYEPRQPRIVGARPDFVASGRFAFQASLADTDDDRRNPWRLLDRVESDGAIPVVVDANSMTYVLHRALGDEIVLARGGRDQRLRIVAALADSVFQSELVMSEANFLRLFPFEEGYRLLLVETPPDRATEVAARIEDSLSDFGADAVGTADRLAEFHTVENTYLSTFQTLGGLGLLLGTIGLAAVLLRNVLERRRELALLGAVGYRRKHLFVIILAENSLVLAFGLIAGVMCALVAVLPAAADHGGRLPTSAGAWLLLFAVFVTGVLSSIVATRVAVHTRLLEALRAE